MRMRKRTATERSRDANERRTTSFAAILFRRPGVGLLPSPTPRADVISETDHGEDAAPEA